MSRRRLTAFLLTGAMAALLITAACASDASPTPTPGDKGTEGTLTSGSFSSQDVESLTRALSAGSLGGILPQTLNGQQSGVWVTGRGEVTTTPDLALLRLGVEARADTVAEAGAEAANALTDMLDVLEAAGLEDEDLQTRFFNIQPQYTSREVRRCTFDEKPDEPIILPEVEIERGLKDECYNTYEQVIVGYIVNNQLTAKIRDLDEVGDIIDQVAEAGGDLVRIQGISFTVEDTTTLEEQAREQAILALVTKANQIADVAGIQLGKLVYITESGGGLPRIESDFARAAPAIAFAESVTHISGGELEVTVTVQGVFSIGD